MTRVLGWVAWFRRPSAEEAEVLRSELAVVDVVAPGIGPVLLPLEALEREEAACG